MSKAAVKIFLFSCLFIMTAAAMEPDEVKIALRVSKKSMGKLQKILSGEGNQHRGSTYQLLKAQGSREAVPIFSPLVMPLVKISREEKQPRDVETKACAVLREYYQQNNLCVCIDHFKRGEGQDLQAVFTSNTQKTFQKISEKIADCLPGHTVKIFFTLPMPGDFSSINPEELTRRLPEKFTITFNIPQQSANVLTGEEAQE